MDPKDMKLTAKSHTEWYKKIVPYKYTHWIYESDVVSAKVACLSTPKWLKVDYTTKQPQQKERNKKIPAAKKQKGQIGGHDI